MWVEREAKVKDDKVVIHPRVLQTWKSPVMYVTVEQTYQYKHLACASNEPDMHTWHRFRMCRHEAEFPPHSIDTLSYITGKIEERPQQSFHARRIYAGRVNLTDLIDKAELKGDLVWVCPPEDFYPPGLRVIELWAKKSYEDFDSSLERPKDNRQFWVGPDEKKEKSLFDLPPWNIQSSKDYKPRTPFSFTWP